MTKIAFFNQEKLTFYQLRNTYSTAVNYCYMIINNQNKEAIIIDPAWEMDKFDVLIKQHQISISSVLLTHHHADHVDLAEAFAKKYNCNVLMSHNEISYYGYKCKNLVPIDKEDDFVLHGIKINPIFTPGHTVGSICYLIDGHLYTGDTLFIEGCGLCTARGGDPYEMYASLNRIKKIIPTDTKVYPGHCYGKELGQSMAAVLKHNIYLQFPDVDKFVSFRMRKHQKNLFDFK